MSDRLTTEDPKLSNEPREVPDAVLDRVAGGGSNELVAGDQTTELAAGDETSEFIGPLVSPLLSNVEKTRSEISMTFARNARA